MGELLGSSLPVPLLPGRSGRSSGEPTACPTPSSSTICRQQSNHATAQVHHCKPKGHCTAGGDTVQQEGTLWCSRKEATRETENSCFSNRRKINYFTDGPPCFIFLSVTIDLKMSWLAEVTVLWKTSSVVKTGISVNFCGSSAQPHSHSPSTPFIFT